MDLVTASVIAHSMPLEYIYHLSTSNAFKTINGAVVRTLARGRPGYRIDYDAHEGVIIYPLNAAGTLTQLYVRHITDDVAAIELDFCMPTDPSAFMQWRERPPDPTAQHLLTHLFVQCHQEIVRSLRYAATIEVHPPPPPPKDDLLTVLTWQAIYFPEMHDENLAKLIGIEYQSLRNARSRLGMGKHVPSSQLVRIPRGRQNKGK